MHEGAGPLLQGKPFSPGHGSVLARRRLGATCFLSTDGADGGCWPISKCNRIASA